MKKIVAIVILLLLFTSCVTQKRCFQKFPPQVITKDSIVLKDTTIYIPVKFTVPGDSIYLTDTIPCPDVEYKKEVKSPSGRATAKVEISKGKLTVDCKIDSLNTVIDSLEVKVKTLEKYRSEIKIVEKPIIKKVTPLWVWLMLAGIIIYFLGIPIVKALINK